MPSESPSRIAVVGAGLIGRAHVAALQACAAGGQGGALSALVDPSPSAQALAEQAGVPWYSDLSELLTRDRPDGVVLATPNAWHVPQALQCVQAGLPTLVEKPIAPTVAEAESLVEAVQRSGVPVLIGHHRAHSPIMARARDAVAQGLLGRLVAVTGTALFFKPDHYFEEGPWRTQPGGGPILINLIHEVHNLRMLCGEIVAVQALASNAVRGFAVEDTVAINLRFASGVLGTFLLSDTAASAQSWEQTSQENKAYPSYDDVDCYSVVGTQGSLAVPTLRLKRYARLDDRSWWTPFETSVLTLRREDPIALQMAHFCAVVRGAVQPLVSARDGLANLRVTDAIVRAAQTGGLVNLDPI